MDENESLQTTLPFAIWRQLEVQHVWDPTQAKEVPCIPILINFSRLLSSDCKVVLEASKKDWLFGIIALFGKSLKAMELEELYAVMTKKSVKTLLLIKQLKDNQDLLTAELSQLAMRDAQGESKSKESKSTESKFTSTESTSTKLKAIESELTSTESTESTKTNLKASQANESASLESRLTESESPDHENDGVTDKEEEEELGDFDGVFSDSSSDDDDDDEQCSDEDNFVSEFNEFVSRVRRNKKQGVTGKKGVENLILAAASFDRSYSLPDETVCHLLLIAVRKRYRKFGIGQSMIKMLKDPLIVGPYDAMFTYAEQDAVKFFRRCEFTDDPILASKYSKVSDNWLNSVPMCFIPPFSSSTDIGCRNADNQNIAVVEEQIEQWKHHQVASYQCQMKCVLRLKQLLKSLKETVEEQKKTIEDLKSENSLLHRRIYSSQIADDNYVDDMEIRKDNEERIKLDFCQQLLIEKSIRRVEVTDVEKTSQSRLKFEARLLTLEDPLMFDRLYYCGPETKEELQQILKHGFIDGVTGGKSKGLYFSQSPRNAMDFTQPGVVLLCEVGLGKIETISQGFDSSRNCISEGYDSVLTSERPVPGCDKRTGYEYVIYDYTQVLPLHLITYEVEWL